MTGPITAAIFSQGPNSSTKKLMDPKYELLHIDILKDVNRIPAAQIVLSDGDASQKKFEISNAEFFAPGQTIEIQLRYEGSSKDETVFKGIVVKHAVEVMFNQSRLTVHLKDAAIALTTQRKNTVFPKKPDEKITDNQIIEEILGNYDVNVGAIAPTPIEHTEIVQFYATDWDFILSRAEANGLWVIADAGTVSVMSPELLSGELRGTAPLTVEYGQTVVYEFDMEADLQQQSGIVKGQAWNIQDQALTSAVDGTDVHLDRLPGNLKPATLASAIGTEQVDLMTSSALLPQEIQAWADAHMNKTRLSMLRGRVSIPGVAGLGLGDVMEIGGVSDRFNGRTRITGIRHQISPEGWKTDVQFGLSATWFTHNPDIIDAPASGLVPAVNGLQIGIVDTFVADKEKTCRLRVRVPALANAANPTGGIVWARLALLDAGPERGTFFQPEFGDEVILGFLNDDPRQAIILGALHREAEKAPWLLTEENYIKGIVSKKKLQVLLNDEDKKESITLTTPKGNTLIITDEEKKGIQLIDQNKNSIIMDANGIQINSAKDIVFKAKENVVIEGQKVDVK